MQNQFGLNNLYGSRDYDAVIEIWMDEQNHEHFIEWDYVYFMNTFYKLKRYASCLEVYREFHKRFPDSPLLDDKMGWALFHHEIKNYDPKVKRSEQLRRQVDYALAHCSDGKWSPKWRLIQFMVDQIDKTGSGFEQDPWLALSYLDMVDPLQLSREEQIFVGADGKNRRRASDLEYWYSKRSNKLLKAARYEECIKCCDDALETVQGGFHSNNDTWFRYRKAKSLLALGQPEASKVIALPLVYQQFQHWCLWQQMFELARNAGDDNEAIHCGAKCALSDSSHEKRVTFYVRLSDFWESLGRVEETALLQRLVCILREENDWGRKSYQSGWRIPDEISRMDKKEVLGRLDGIWKAMVDPERDLTGGMVEKYNENSKRGIIRADRLGSCLFQSTDFVEKPETVSLGTKVLFKVIDVPDPKKTGGIPYLAREILIVE